MKYSWPKLVREMRNAMMEITTFEGQTPDHTLALIGHFRDQMRHTDTFHCWDFDRDLDKAFNRYPNVKCNYRSCWSYWLHKYGKENIEDAMYTYLEETSNIIQEYFADAWNFPPGYIKPKKITFSDIDAKVRKIRARVMRVVAE